MALELFELDLVCDSYRELSEGCWSHPRGSCIAALDEAIPDGWWNVLGRSQGAK